VRGRVKFVGFDSCVRRDSFDYDVSEVRLWHSRHMRAAFRGDPTGLASVRRNLNAGMADWDTVQASNRGRIRDGGSSVAEEDHSDEDVEVVEPPPEEVVVVETPPEVIVIDPPQEGGSAFHTPILRRNRGVEDLQELVRAENQNLPPFQDQLVIADEENIPEPEADQRLVVSTDGNNVLVVAVDTNVAPAA